MGNDVYLAADDSTIHTITVDEIWTLNASGPGRIEELEMKIEALEKRIQQLESNNIIHF